MYRDIPEELRTLIEPVVTDAGLELVDVSLVRGGRPWDLRITVDTPIGDGRVPVDYCARVAREIGTQLDVADVIEAAYRLEVSSPGLDRVLAREKDFANACGSEVQVETRNPVAGRRRFRGVLLSFEGEVATVDVDGVESKIPFTEISKAKMFYEFSPADFNDSGNSQQTDKTDPKNGAATKQYAKRGKSHGTGARGSGRSGKSDKSGKSGGKTAGRASTRTAEIDS